MSALGSTVRLPICSEQVAREAGTFERKMLLSARVFHSADCCPGSYFPVAWFNKSGKWVLKGQGARGRENNEAYLQRYLGDCVHNGGRAPIG